MNNPTGSTIWPHPPPSTQVKQIIDRFFTLADSKEEDAGARLAKEIFCRNGVFIASNGTFEGTNEITNSRKGAWATVKSPSHEVLKVYMNDAQGTDLFIVGKLTVEMLDGTKSSREFVVRMLFREEDSILRVLEYRVVNPAPSDPRPFLGALM